MSRARSLLVSVAVGLVLASIAQPSPAATAPVITVGGPATSRPIPPGFLGLSLEYFAIPSYAGTDPNAIDPVFVQLVRNLAGGQPPGDQDRGRHHRPHVVADPGHSHPRAASPPP